jgi:hypothetical protein
MQATTQSMVPLFDAASATIVTAAVGPLAALLPLAATFSSIGQALASFGNTTPNPFISTAVPQIVAPPPGADPLSIFISTLVDGVTLSTHIRGG